MANRSGCIPELVQLGAHTSHQVHKIRSEPTTERRVKQMTTEAQRRATEKYINEKTDEIKLRVPKGMKAEIKAKAEAEGKSLNAYIIEKLMK